MRESAPGGVREIADGYLRALAVLEPQAAEALGQAAPVQIGPLGPEAFEARRSVAARAVNALERAEPADHSDRLLHGAMVERLRSDIALHDCGFTPGLLAPLATPVHLTRQVFDSLPLDTPDQVETVRRNLTEIPRALAEYAATLEHTAEQGYVAARRQVQGVAEQVQGWVEADFYGSVAGSVDALAGPAQAATEASRSFAHWLREDLLPRAPHADPVGRERYQITSAAFLGAQVDLDELYAWGWDRIAELQSQAREVARTITGAPDLAVAANLLDADPARQVPAGDPLREWLQQRLDGVSDAVDGRWFDIPTATRPVQAQMVTAASGVMYYTPPNADLTRPGRVWWTVPEGTERISTWRQVSTVHHEGVPGHHLQHAVTHQLQHLHPWQRLMCHVHGYAEGWAHYAEHLAAEIGLLQDPGERLGQIHALLWRACRIVIDLGLHLELPIPEGVLPAARWTPDLGVHMLHEVAGVDRQTARFEVDRYLGWPGQALAFSVGSKLWHDVREEVGGTRDLRRFHARALALGPMGLDALRDALRSLTDEHEEQR